MEIIGGFRGKVHFVMFPTQKVMFPRQKLMFPTYLSAGDCVSNGVGMGGHIPDISIL